MDAERVQSLSREGAPEGRTGQAEAITRASPGIMALLAGIAETRTNLSVLDLAFATDAALRVYTKLARWVRFAGIINEPVCDARSLAKLTDTPEPPYDLVLAWDLFDRVLPHERPALARHLANACAPNARLHVLVSVSEAEESPPFRYSLWDEGHMWCEPLPFRGRSQPCLQPAEVERLLAPFQVARGFALRQRLREYVAIHPGRRRHGNPAV